MPCETQHAYPCHNQCQRRNVSLNIIIIVSKIEMKYHKKYENVWTNNATQ